MNIYFRKQFSILFHEQTSKDFIFLDNIDTPSVPLRWKSKTFSHHVGIFITGS